MTRVLLTVLACWAWGLASPGPAAPVASLDDITYWVGEGPHRAGLVIDWDQAPDAGGPLAWGFRWQGSASSMAMLQAVVAADPRLFLKHGGGIVYGLGYDANADGALPVTPDSLGNGTAFDAQGFAGATYATNARAADPADRYTEGWDGFDYFWHLALSQAAAPTAWASSTQGAAVHALADGEWNAWTFATYLNFAAFPVAPEPAPGALAPGDFNGDGRVDAADYAVWRDGLTTGATQPTGYDAWRDHFGEGSAPAQSATALPAPAGATCVLLTLAALSGARCRGPLPRVAG